MEYKRDLLFTFLVYYFFPDKSMLLILPWISLVAFLLDSSIPSIFHLGRAWKLTIQMSACVEVFIFFKEEKKKKPWWLLFTPF